MKMDEIVKRLKEPFAFEETEWKIRLMNQEKTRGAAVVYLNSRSIQDRLDEVVGVFNWRNEYMLWQEKSQICGISIFDTERSQWITKYDGAENTDNEPIKGGLSDSFKRASVIWGIGRYLYDIEMVWVEIEPRGKGYAIKEIEKSKLQNHYNQSISNNANAIVQEKNTQSTLSKNQESQKKVDYDYKIISTAISGSSAVLQLAGNDGNKITAYVKKDSPGITSGVLLKKVNLEQKVAEFGSFYVMKSYEIAA